MMTKAEREDLLKLARARAKLAREEVAVVTATRKAEFRQQLAREYKWERDGVWKEAYETVKAAATEANETIRRRAQDLGIPPEFAPSLSDPYWAERGENSTRHRRAELTQVANTRYDADASKARLSIERWLVAAQAKLVADGLESGEAKAFLEDMPTADKLVHLLSVAEAEKLLLASPLRRIQ